MFKAETVTGHEVVETLILPSVQVVLMRHRGDDIEYFLLHRTAGSFLGHWALPGGKKDPGETDPETGCREIFEETGILLKPKQLAFLRDTESTTNRIINGQSFIYRYPIKVFYAFIDGQSPSNTSPDEHDAGRWFTKKEAIEFQNIAILNNGRTSLDCFLNHQTHHIAPKTLETIKLLSNSRK